MWKKGKELKSKLGLCPLPCPWTILHSRDRNILNGNFPSDPTASGGLLTRLPLRLAAARRGQDEVGQSLWKKIRTIFPKYKLWESIALSYLVILENRENFKWTPIISRVWQVNYPTGRVGSLSRVPVPVTANTAIMVMVASPAPSPSSSQSNKWPLMHCGESII